MSRVKILSLIDLIYWEPQTFPQCSVIKNKSTNDCRLVLVYLTVTNVGLVIRSTTDLTFWIPLPLTRLLASVATTSIFVSWRRSAQIDHLFLAIRFWLSHHVELNLSTHSVMCLLAFFVTLKAIGLVRVNGMRTLRFCLVHGLKANISPAMWLVPILNSIIPSLYLIRCRNICCLHYPTIYVKVYLATGSLLHQTNETPTFTYRRIQVLITCKPPVLQLRL